MVQDVGVRAMIEPELDEGSVDRQTDDLAEKVDRATMADLEVGDTSGLDGVASGEDLEAGGGVLGGVASGGLTKVALAGAVGAGLLMGISSLAGDFAPRFNKTMDLIWQGLGMIAGSILQPIADVLEGPAKAFFDVGKTALEDGLGAAAGEGTEMAGEATLEAIGAGEIIEDTTAEQIIGAASLSTLVLGGIAASSFVTSLIGSTFSGAGSLLGTLGAAGGIGGASGFLATLGIAGGTIAAASIITAVALDKLVKTSKEAPKPEGEDVVLDRSLGSGVDRQQFGSVTDVPGQPPEWALPEGMRGTVGDIVGDQELDKSTGVSPELSKAGVDRVSPALTRATGKDTTLGSIEGTGTATVTLESGEQIQVDNSNLEQKLDELKGAIEDIDTSYTFDERSLSRGTDSADASFRQRMDRGDNSP